MEATNVLDGLFRYFRAYRGYRYQLANAYLFNCSSPAGSHFVVMDVLGNFYDPSPTPLKEYNRCNIYEVRPYNNE